MEALDQVCRENGVKNRSTKHQLPSSRETPSSKSQTRAGLRQLRKKGAFNLMFGASLELDTWMLELCQTRKSEEP
jgi:hypothetical protein